MLRLTLPLLALVLAGCAGLDTHEVKNITTADGVTYTLELERAWVKKETELRYQARLIAQDYCLAKGQSLLPQDAVSTPPATERDGAHLLYRFMCVGFVQGPRKDLNEDLHHLGFYKSEESKAEMLKELKEHPLEDSK